MSKKVVKVVGGIVLLTLVGAAGAGMYLNKDRIADAFKPDASERIVPDVEPEPAPVDPASEAEPSATPVIKAPVAPTLTS